MGLRVQVCFSPFVSFFPFTFLLSPPAVCLVTPCDKWCGHGCSGLLQVLPAQLSSVKAHHLTAYLPSDRCITYVVQSANLVHCYLLLMVSSLLTQSVLVSLEELIPVNVAVVNSAVPAVANHKTRPASDPHLLPLTTTGYLPVCPLASAGLYMHFAGQDRTLFETF